METPWLLMYFNNTANEMRVYDGANWIAATAAGNVSLILYEYNAGANQTTFSGSDTNSATLYTVDNLQVVASASSSTLAISQPPMALALCWPPCGSWRCRQHLRLQVIHHR